MNRRFGGIILDSAFRILIPFMVVYGFYVLTHGEYSPGGGFQAGGLIAIAIVSVRLVIGARGGYAFVGEKAAIVAGLGAFLYVLTGLIPLFTGGKFLEYGMLPFDFNSMEKLHSTGILMIEMGVTVCVTATIINILDAVLERGDTDDNDFE